MSMWRPFTERARRAIVLAQEVAQRYGDRFILPDHIFIAIVQEGGSIAAEAVTALGAGRADVEIAAEKRMKTIASRPAGEEMLFSDGAKRVIEFAFEQAQALQHKYLSTEHLLLGYIRETDSKNSILLDLPVDRAALKRTILDFLEREPKSNAPSSGAPALPQHDVLSFLFSDIERLDSPGLRSAVEHESRRRLYYIDTEDLWKRLQAAVGRRDVVGSLMYALFINRRENRTAVQTIDNIRQRISESYG